VEQEKKKNDARPIRKVHTRGQSISHNTGGRGGEESIYRPPKFEKKGSEIPSRRVSKELNPLVEDDWREECWSNNTLLRRRGECTKPPLGERGKKHRHYLLGGSVLDKNTIMGADPHNAKSKIPHGEKKRVKLRWRDRNVKNSSRKTRHLRGRGTD